MDALEADYRAGRISRTEYYRQSESLQARSDAWAAQNNATAVLGAAAIGTAATVGGALIQPEATEDMAHAINKSNRGGGHGPSKPSAGGTKKKRGRPKTQTEPKWWRSSRWGPPGGGGPPPR